MIKEITFECVKDGRDRVYLLNGAACRYRISNLSVKDILIDDAGRVWVPDWDNKISVDCKKDLKSE